jgi:hypothetical protein
MSARCNILLPILRCLEGEIFQYGLTVNVRVHFSPILMVMLNPLSDFWGEEGGGS